jgi:putative PIN family toxin of toxin-antitoxin system
VTRVVVDTNVYISALVFGGVPQGVLELISSQGLPLYISPSIMEEVSGILAAKFGWTNAELDLFLPPLWDRCIIIKPTIRLKVCADPDDNHVLECAVAAEAEFLVTGNAKHFPKDYKDTKVVSPRQLLDILLPEK